MIKVLQPPKGDEMGIMEPVLCSECACEAEVHVSRDRDTAKPIAQCPECGKKKMFTNYAKYRTGIGARGPGFHGTKFGYRRKADMIRRNEKLRDKQWENMEPLKVSEGSKPRNPTKGGVYDPNSKFNKGKKKKSQIYLPK